MTETKRAVDFELYVDGSCVPNPGVGGWACVIRSATRDRPLYGHLPNTTNNRAELLAIYNGLRYLNEENDGRGFSVRVVSDSQYAISVIKGEWQSGGNTDLVEPIREEMQGNRVYFEWVRGHTGNPLNERCDKLAALARASKTVVARPVGRSRL